MSRVDPSVPLVGERCECPTCGCLCNSTSAFEAHRTGQVATAARRCRSVTEMLASGMTINRAGYWVTRPKFAPVGALNGPRRVDLDGAATHTPMTPEIAGNPA